MDNVIHYLKNRVANLKIASHYSIIYYLTLRAEIKATLLAE